MEKKRLKRLPPNWQKMLSRLVSPVSGHLLSSIFFISALVRSYLTIPPVPKQGQRLAHPSGVLQTCYCTDTNTFFIFISSKQMLTSKLQFRQRTVSISTYSGRIMTQVKYQINIFVRSISMSDHYLCQINIYVIPMQWA